MTGDRMHQRTHVPSTPETRLRLWATGIGKSFKLDQRQNGS